MECETKTGRFFRACRFVAIRAVFCAIAMNAIFYLIIGSRTMHNSRKINQHILNAFENGDLQSEDFPKRDSYRGIDQFSDACLLMQMQFGTTHWYDKFILMPLLLHTDETPSLNEDLRMVSLYVKRTLDEGKPLPVSKDSYHRYWEGQVPIGAFLLANLELAQVRLLLTELAYLSFAVLAMVALRVSRRLFCCFFPVVVYGILFSGIPYLGQLMIHMGFMISIYVLAGFLFVVDRKNTYGVLVCASAVVGMLCLFIDQLCGITMQTISLMVPAAYYLGHKCRSLSAETEVHEAVEIKYVLMALSAFFCGAVFSYAMKIGLLFWIYGFYETIGTIIWKLDNWMAGAHTTILDAWGAIAQNMFLNTFRHESLARLILLIGAVSWVASLILPLVLRISSRFRNQEGYWIAFSMHLLAVLVILGWFAVFRFHTKVHAWFMARYLYIPLALGWSNLMIIFFACQQTEYRRDRNGRAGM